MFLKLLSYFRKRGKYETVPVCTDLGCKKKKKLLSDSLFSGKIVALRIFEEFQ